MSLIFIFLLLLCKCVTSDLDISSENTAKKVISLNIAQNDEDCNSDLSLINKNVNLGGKLDFGAEALGGETDAGAKKFESRGSGGRAFASSGGKAEAGTKDELPCSTPLDGYQQDDPILVRFDIPASCFHACRSLRQHCHQIDESEQGEPGLKMPH